MSVNTTAATNANTATTTATNSSSSSTTTATTNTSSSQVLPPRENSLFKKILKHFKDKQFKNGLKICNQILSNPKFAEHGETLSMKGLILNSMGKKQEALEYVRRGLKNDVKSHVCWHVFGLLQKADHKYEEAIKCYRNALRWKKDSVQILSDLSLVQIQTRDLEGYRDSRYQLFSLRPGERSTWIGCAMAYHLTGDHSTAVNILSEYQKSSSTNNNVRNRNNRRQNNEIYEHSELLLYHIFILLECHRYEEALTLLDSHENDIVDKVSYFEYKCEIYLALQRYEDAQQILLKQLIDRNPENASYFSLLEQAKQIDINDETQRLQLYDEMAKSYPRSQTVARLPLNFVTIIDVFRQRIDAYLKKGFRKGQPALFRDLKNLYQNELKNFQSKVTNANLNLSLNSNIFLQELSALIKSGRTIVLSPKIQVIETLLFEYAQNLLDNGTFDGKSDDEESATCLLWVYYFLAQHFDVLKEFTIALHFANLALVHTPTLIDIFVIKAKIFKHAGLLEKAVKCLDEAQSLDTSDRYLNSKCAKYLIRCNKIKEAEEMCLKFTREGVSAAENLNEMQCMWFQNEVAKAYKRMGMWGSALLKCIQIDNHFAEISEDQFEFNTYCILKVTLRAYVKMIRLEDRIKSHRFFINAALTAIEIYLRLYDNPIDCKSDADSDMNSNLSASELRKMRNKQRKAMLKAEKEQNDKLQKKPNTKKDSEFKQEETEMIDPIKLEKTETPLQDVARFLNPVKIFGGHREEIHLMAFEVYYRKGKLLLQLQSLKKAYRICIPGTFFHTLLLSQTSLFLNYLFSMKEQLNETIRTVLAHELPTIKVFNLNKKLNGDKFDLFNELPTVEQFIDQYLPSNSDSFLVRTEHLRVKNIFAKIYQTNDNNLPNGNVNEMTPSTNEENEKIFKNLIEDLEKLTGLSLEHCEQFYSSIKENRIMKINDELIENLREKLHSLYPFASCFMNEKQMISLENELSTSDYFTAEPEEYNNNNTNNCNNNTNNNNNNDDNN